MSGGPIIGLLHHHRGHDLWWNLAAAKGDADAVTPRDKVAAKMMPAQLAESQKLAREGKPKAHRLRPVRADHHN